ncbi:HsdM N-terminal domain [Geoglobus ahangari]|uniref:site-specific DNA-methyltransferase (adenine-specific) n=1 Tax=Geoglobus ahangari TaxID=113653 RepID=A0A0F7IFR3_9EURY|nr:type I restriction-modification system subunit M N-terminal domain-containing protein [Geoglobus ahangari]AKG91324.1 HsdM N-terminal domain [Geoglobus ahangari]
MTLADYIEIETTRDELIRACKQAADLIRTRVDYKYILVLLFLKRLSDEWKREYNEALKTLLEKGLSKEEAENFAKDRSFHRFEYPERYTWEELRKNINELPVRLSEALKLLAEKNPELQGVVDRLDFLEFTRHRDNFDILVQLFELFSGLILEERVIASSVMLMNG